MRDGTILRRYAPTASELAIKLRLRPSGFLTRIVCCEQLAPLSPAYGPRPAIEIPDFPS
jgi:hypothetical protein